MGQSLIASVIPSVVFKKDFVRDISVRNVTRLVSSCAVAIVTFPCSICEA